MLIIHLKKNKLTPHNSRKTLKQKNPEIKKQWAWISLNLSGADITSVLTAAQPLQLSCPLEADGGSYKAVEEAGAEGLGVTEGLRVFSLEKGNLITLLLYERRLCPGFGPFPWLQAIGQEEIASGCTGKGWDCILGSFFTKKVKHWNCLLREAMELPSLEVFKKCGCVI